MPRTHKSHNVVQGVREHKQFFFSGGKKWAVEAALTQVPLKWASLYYFIYI